jgi:hypothetical protein
LQVEKLYVIKMGEVALLKDGQEVHDPTYIKEAGGFTFFGDTSLDAITRSPYQVSQANKARAGCMSGKPVCLSLGRACLTGRSG